MPTCNEIGEHPGYTWVIDNKFSSNAGDRVTTGLESCSGFCVSAFTGAVGHITESGTCHIDAAGHILPQTKYKDDEWGDDEMKFYNAYEAHSLKQLDVYRRSVIKSNFCTKIEIKIFVKNPNFSQESSQILTKNRFLWAKIEITIWKKIYHL